MSLKNESEIESNIYPHTPTKMTIDFFPNPQMVNHKRNIRIMQSDNPRKKRINEKR